MGIDAFVEVHALELCQEERGGKPLASAAAPVLACMPDRQASMLFVTEVVTLEAAYIERKIDVAFSWVSCEDTSRGCHWMLERFCFICLAFRTKPFLFFGIYCIDHLTLALPQHVEAFLPHKS